MAASFSARSYGSARSNGALTAASPLRRFPSLASPFSDIDRRSNSAAGLRSDHSRDRLMFGGSAEREWAAQQQRAAALSARKHLSSKHQLSLHDPSASRNLARAHSVAGTAEQRMPPKTADGTRTRRSEPQLLSAKQEAVLTACKSARRAAQQDCAAHNLRAIQDRQHSLTRDLEEARSPARGDFFGRFGTSLA